MNTFSLLESQPQMGLPTQEMQHQAQCACVMGQDDAFSFCPLFLYIHPLCSDLSRFVWINSFCHLSQHVCFLKASTHWPWHKGRHWNIFAMQDFYGKHWNLLSSTKIWYSHSKILSKYLSNNSDMPIRSESATWVRVGRHEWVAELSSPSLC